MKFKIFLFICLMSSFYASAQTTNATEQQKAIELEKENLKNGRISYEEYQQRVEKINQANVVTEAPSENKNAAPTETNPAVTKTDASKETSTVKAIKKQKNTYERTAGDELISFTNEMYGGLILVSVASLIVPVGAALSAGGLVVVGVIAYIAGTVFMVKSFSRIKKAGKIMNYNERGY